MSRRVHALDEGYFDSMDSAEKWYWYGFILADGCIFTRRNGSEHLFQLRLAARDQDHLEQLRHALCFDGHLRRLPASEGTAAQDSVTLSVYSRRFCRRLIELGVVQRKSLIGHPMPVVPKPSFHEFLRGHFDANGYASFETRTRNFNIGFSGTPRLMRWLHEWIHHLSDVSGGSLTLRQGCAELKFRGNCQVRRLAEWLYESTGPYLHRKRLVLAPLLGGLS